MHIYPQVVIVCAMLIYFYFDFIKSFFYFSVISDDSLSFSDKQFYRKATKLIGQQPRILLTSMQLHKSLKREQKKRLAETVLINVQDNLLDIHQHYKHRDTKWRK